MASPSTPLKHMRNMASLRNLTPYKPGENTKIVRVSLAPAMRRVLKEACETGDRKLVHRMARAVIDQASGILADGSYDPQKANLAAFELVHNVVDGPIAKSQDVINTSGPQQQIVIVQDLSRESDVINTSASISASERSEPERALHTDARE